VRRRLCLGAAGVAAAVAVTAWALEPRPGVTEANTRRIREGMTPDQVEGILGGPPTRRIDFPGRGPDGLFLGIWGTPPWGRAWVVFHGEKGARGPGGLPLANRRPQSPSRVEGQ
jgi:hypothetical protein